jgi:hypothetical protein
MSEFDDPELGEALRRAAGGPVDEQAAFERVATAAVRARRRRRAAVAGGWVAATILAVGGVVALTGGDDERIAPATVPETAELPTVATTVPPSSAPPMTTAPTMTTAPPMTRPATTAVPTTTTTETEPTTTEPATTAPTTTEPVTTAPTSEATPDTQTFPSPGGSIAVRLEYGELALAGTPAPAAGYSYRIEDDRADRVRVRFCGAEDSYRITVTIAGGEMVPEVEPGSATGSCG